MKVNRGDIYYIKRRGQYQGNEIAKDRPGVIVSAEHLNAGAGCVEVVYLTSQPKKDMAEHVPLLATGRCSTALCEQIYSVSVDRLSNYYGRASESEMRDIDEALRRSLALEPIGGGETAESRISTPCGADFERVKIERDTYRKLYEQLLDKLTR